MKTLIKLIIASSAFLASSLYAEDGASIVFNVASYHINTKEKFNQRNTGIGLEYRKGDITYGIGEYNNSLWRHSNYVTIAYTPIKYGKFEFGGMTGLVNGYPQLNDGKYGPIAAGVVQYNGLMGVGINFVFLPPVKSPLTIGLQLKYKF